MRCEHHPDYDPASVEPVGELAFKERFIKGNPNVLVPCPYCWQVYARHLCNLINEEDLEAFRNVDRIIQLKADLAIMTKKAEGTYGLAKLDLENQLEEAKADLAKFGGHTAECASQKPFPIFTLWPTSWRVPEKCNCGYAEAQERLG